MSEKKKLEPKYVGFLRCYEQHRKLIDLTTAVTPELERYSANLRDLTNRWAEVGMTFIKKSEMPAEPNLRNNIALLYSDGTEFNETDGLSEFDCLRGQLSVLRGCFAQLPAWLLFEVKEQGKECFPSSINDASSNLRLVQKLLILSNEESVLRLLISAAIVLKKTEGLLESIEISSTMIHDDLSGGIRFLPKMLFAAADLIDEATKLTQLAGETARSNEKNWLKYEKQLARQKSPSRCDTVFPMWELASGFKIKEVSLPKSQVSCSDCGKLLEINKVNIFEELKNSDRAEGLENRDPTIGFVFLCDECLGKKTKRGSMI